MPQARVRRNDARILASTVEAASSTGWSGVSLSQVGKGAGLTIQPVRSRYPSRVLLAAAAWTEVVGPALQSAMSDALASSGLLDRPPSEAEFAASMSEFAVPNVELRAAAELVVVSSFESVLREAVDATIVPAVRSWLDPDAAGGPVRAAKRGYLLMLALGLLATANRPGIPDTDFAGEWHRLLAVLGTEQDPVQLPDEPRPPHLAFIPFDTGDATTDDLLRAAIDHLGTHGYEGSVLSVIAADADVSEATIFLRYPSKEAFFMDAINRQQDIAMPGQRAYYARVEDVHGAGIADAVAIRGTLHPSERLISIIEMERVRLTWHRPNLAAADENRLQELVRGILEQQPGNLDYADPARLHLARARALGINFMPLIDDQAWDLPYDVVTRPLNDA